MAFSKTPSLDTYNTERIPLTREINARDGGQAGKDENFLNVFTEPVRARIANDKREFVVKRSGTVKQVASVAASPGRGMFFWKDEGKLFYCVSDDIYVYDVNTGTSTTLSAVFTTTSGYVGFCEYLYDNNTVVVCATDGTRLVKIDSSNVVTTCADADLPSPHLPYPVFLDGYLFLVKADSADVYNSDLNDPMVWTAGNFLSAEMEGDLVVRIAKLNNYLIVFGTETIEYFWDAANATGSPLQRNDTPVKMNMYLGGFAQYENSIFFVGAGAGGQPDVYVLRDFKIENLGSPTVSRYLNSTSKAITEWTSSIISAGGHTFYVINAGSDATWVYDVDTKLWAKWAFKTGTSFPITHASVVKSNSNVRTYFMLEENLSDVYRFNDTSYQDDGVNFRCEIVTESTDFGMLNRKTMSRLSVISDRPNSNSNLLVQWSDDDYQTFNSGFNINLNQDLPSIYRLGWFRQRNFKLTHTDNVPLRIQALEVDINKGNA